MKITIVAALLALAPAAAMAQKWELGLTGGYSFLNEVNATGGPSTAKAGFAPGLAAGAFLGENLYRHVSGEIRYEYMQSDLRLTSGGQRADFTGSAHALHYDVVFHTAGGSEVPVQGFASIGGGLKAFTGSGTESATQPLSQYGYFTKASQVKPMLTGSAGIKVRVSSGVSLRFEVRDFATQFPTDVLTPPPGVKYSKWLNQIVPMFSVVFTR
ncbi:MAG TPA: hypothetical protein VFT60_12595 [Bryobacteraceae bacterium]|nr:hypothetical protein [Bryobacteraceae bacterium]